MMYDHKKLVIIFLLFFTISLDSQEFVTKKNFYQLSDFVYTRNQTFDPAAVFDGAIIWVHHNSLGVFLKHIFPRITKKFILISMGDKGVPGMFSEYLENPKLLAWFGTNPTTFSEEKFIPIPVGVSSAIDAGLFKGGSPRCHMLYFNMSIAASHSSEQKERERRRVHDLFANKEYCYISPMKPLDEYVVDLKRSRFVLSPRGNGLDCYRTWEAMAAGAIPVVRHSSMDGLYSGLPVLIVDDWQQINEDYLMEKEKEIRGKKWNRDRLYFPYWKNLIEGVLSKNGIYRDPLVPYEREFP